jgi:hypothetical protein
MLEVASELVGQPDFEPKQVRIQFRPQGADSWHHSMFGSDALDAANEVAEGSVDFAILNPAAIVSKAVRGVAPFSAPIPLRAVATVPSYDQLGLAVSRDLGVASVEELISLQTPLRVSLRGDRPDHSVHAIVDDVLAAIGLPLDAIVARGGKILYQEGIPHQEPRAGAIRRREVDVVIDEGIYNWVDLAIDSGFVFLSLPESALEELGEEGHRRAVISADDYELLTEDVVTIDFSGFLIYTHERMSDDLVTRFCQAMIERSDRIPWQGGQSLPLRHMVSDTVDAPIPIPFHPAAEAVWRSAGYLD